MEPAEKSAGSEPPPQDPIQGLNLSGAGVLNLPASIGNFSYITTLIVSMNQLTKLPPEIGRLVNLEKLDVSKNSLLSLPREIGRLRQLKELDIHANNISIIPPEAGRLVRLEKFRLDGNPINSPPFEVLTKDVRSIIFWLRDNIEASRPLPPRRLISKMSLAPNHTPEKSCKVMCYNLLAPSYATPTMYPHCPSWALDWTYRSNLILRELRAFGADVICLQEVETEHFEIFFAPELAKDGFEGIHRPKSRYNTMSDEDRRFVDGCAIFWRASKFELCFEQLIDFVEQTLARGADFLNDHNAFNRLISKDNIGLVAILEVKSHVNKPASGHFASPHDIRASPQPRKTMFDGFDEDSFKPDSQYILICNTHIHWNPEFMDVKLMQTQLLIEEVQKLMPRNIKMPVVICGDFNSTPDSGVWEFLHKGHLPPQHSDFGKLQWGHYTHSKNGQMGRGCTHDLNLDSAYYSVLGHEPSFTNASFDFTGCLSYIWFTPQTLRVHGVLETISKQALEEEIAMPNSQFPSDHLSLFAEFIFDDKATKDHPHAIQSSRPSNSQQQHQHHPQQRIFRK